MSEQPQLCEFCRGPAGLLCDGLIAPKQTCDRRMCRKCAGAPVQSMHVSRSPRRLSGWETFDLCPDCRKAGRQVYELVT